MNKCVLAEHDEVIWFSFPLNAPDAVIDRRQECFSSMAHCNLPSPPAPPPPSLPRCAWLLFFDLCPSLAGGRSRCPELANNNQGVALCDTPSLGLDNDQAADGQYAGEWQPLHRGPLRERRSLRVRMRGPSQRSSPLTPHPRPSTHPAY